MAHRKKYTLILFVFLLLPFFAFADETITTTASNNSAVGYNWGRVDQPYAMQTFTTGTGGDTDSVEISVVRTGTPTGDVQIDVFAVDGSNFPTGASLASGTISAASITNCTLANISLSSANLSASTRYVLRYSVVSGASNVNFWNVCGNGSSGSGEFTGYYDGSWHTDGSITARALIYLVGSGGGGGGSTSVSTSSDAYSQSQWNLFNSILLLLIGFFGMIWLIRKH